LFERTASRTNLTQSRKDAKEYSQEQGTRLFYRRDPGDGSSA
jgi:hypothetical protein